METKGLDWWARADSNRRPLPCQGSAGPQIAAGATPDQQDTGKQSGPQLDHGPRSGPAWDHFEWPPLSEAWRALGDTARRAGADLRAFAETFRFIKREHAARSHARRFARAAGGAR